MSKLHETRLRVVSLRWTVNPNDLHTSVPEMMQVGSLPEPASTQIVTHVQSFDRLLIPYNLNFSEAVTGGLTVRRPILDAWRDPETQYSSYGIVVDWIPEIYLWQATDNKIYYARATDGAAVLMSPSKYSEIDLALRITFTQEVGTYYKTNIASSVTLIPVR